MLPENAPHRIPTAFRTAPIIGWLEEPKRNELQWMYSPLLPMFLLARNLAEISDTAPQLSSLIAELVLRRRRPDGTWGQAREESFEIAIAVLTLQHCGCLMSNAASVISFLENTQGVDGSWPWAPIFSDGDGNWFGHRALSTVLCAGALDLLNRFENGRSSSIL
jgi:hypothetical protein